MTRSYQRRYKRYGRHSDREAMLTLVVLLAIALWIRQPDIALRWLAITLVIVSLIILVAVYVKLLMKKNYNKRQKALDLSGIDHMDGLVFEKYVAWLLVKQGYTKIKLTERYDYGVDIIARKDDIVWGIQVKRYARLVKAEAVRQVVTGLNKYNCDKAIVITNSTFSRVAKELTRTNNCLLIDRDELAKWISRA